MHDKVQQEQTTKIAITNDTTETEVKMKDEQKNGKSNLKEINEKLDNLTSLVEENQGQIRLLSCWANPVKNIENKIFWIKKIKFH